VNSCDLGLRPLIDFRVSKVKENFQL